MMRPSRAAIAGPEWPMTCKITTDVVGIKGPEEVDLGSDVDKAEQDE